MSSLRTVRRLLVLGVACWFTSQIALAATIQGGPPTSTTGTFTLTWPAGYTLRSVNGSWQYASPPTTSYAFTNLPSGTYKFLLWTCYQVYEPPKWLTDCAQDSASALTVNVTRDAEVAINTTTTEAGTTPYDADVTLRGSARIDVPIRVIPGVNGFAPDLTLRYDSARKGDVSDKFTADDTLGYGWFLDGTSVIARCRVGLSGTSKPDLIPTDRLCLDGEPLLAVSGVYWDTNTEYRTERQSFVRVFGRSWGFEVFYPDGRVARFGDTTDSKTIASGDYGNDDPDGWWGPNATYIWAIRQVTNGFGDTMTYAYDRFDPYGMLTLKSISYGGATVELKYGPRSELLGTSLGTTSIKGLIWRQAYLHTIRVKMNGTAIREYRLDSNLTGGYMRLDKIQECGYNTAGTGASCLRPLTVGWTAVAGASSPISVTSLTDGLGAVTQFAYAAVTTTTNPLTYGETPFGATIAPTEAAPRAIAVVSEMKRSDGLTTAGRRRTTYAYKGLAHASTLNRGFIGFYEVRVKDEQSGGYSYIQTRLDFPLAGLVSQVRRFTNLFGSGTELEREEHAFGIKTQTANVKYTYPARSTRWVFEGSATVGGSETVFAPCFRALSADTCPGTGTEGETLTQMVSTTVTGTTVSNPAFTPSKWGDVPNRAISGTELTTTSKVNLGNTTTPWVVGAPVKTIATTTAAGEAAKTVTNTFSYKSGTREPLSRNRLPGDATLNLVESRTFTGNNVTSETISGSGITSRTVNYGTYFLDRYPISVANALSQTTNLTYDQRFGEVSEATDADGNVTTIDHDPFGRMIRVVAQDGTETETTYQRCDVVSCTAVAGAVAAMKVTTTVLNGSIQVAPAQARYLDVLGREVLTEVQALSSTNGWRRQRTVFNNRGLVQYRSIPYFSTQTTPTCSAPSSNCTWFAYDIRDRVTLEDRPDAGYLNTAYAGAAGSVTVTSTDTINTGVTRVKRAVFNVLGQLTQTIDAFGTGLATTTSYDYDSHGNLDNVIVGSVQMAAMSYNLAGYRTSLTDANTGAWTFTFDTLGNLTRSVDAKAQDTRYTYDLLNRPTQRVDLYGTTSAVTNTWNWDTLNGTGQLESRSRPGFTETYTYRAADSKLQSVATAINISMVHSGNYTRTFGYDTQGRLSTMSYPSGSTFSYAYNARGYLTQLKSGATVLENVLGTDAFGSPTETTFANGLTTVRGYQPATGRITSIQTGPVGVPTSIQDLEYTWRANSTLYKRIDHRNTSTTADDYVDTFSYNALEQLTSQVTSGGASRTLSFAYSSWGNLTSKTSNVGPDLDVTGYTYGTAGKPHRLTAVTIRGVSNTLSYDGNGNITTYNAASGDDTFLVYDGRNRVTRITVGATTGTSTPTARDEFWYDPDGQRFLGKEWWDDGGTQKQARMVYLGNFEEVIPAAGSPYNLVQRTDLSSSVRHIRTRTTAGTFATRFEYVYRDLLGSVDVVTNSAGVKLNAKLSFDAFGGRRQETWGSDITASAMTTILANEDERFARGFTDHEMLNRTGFVHMNGRVYDPRIGRFVSPDPIVQFPTFSQSYNRYAYVFNSPMSFTDPSGLALVSVTIDGKGGISVSGPAGVIRSIASAIAGAFEKIRQVLSKGGGGNAAAVGFGTTVGVGSRIGGPAGGHSKQGGGAGGGTTGGGSQEEKPDTSWSGVANEALQGRLRVRGNRIFGSIRIAAEDPGTTDNLDDFIAQANQYLNGRRVVDDGVAYRSDIRLVRSSQENADISLGSFFVGHPKDHLFVDAIGGRRIFMHNNGYWPDASTPAHEVGHLLGLPHQPHGANSLMRQHPLEGRALSASDIRELISVYR